jgi:hypothetical protein
MVAGWSVTSLAFHRANSTAIWALSEAANELESSQGCKVQKNYSFLINVYLITCAKEKLRVGQGCNKVIENIRLSTTPGNPDIRIRQSHLGLKRRQLHNV